MEDGSDKADHKWSKENSSMENQTDTSEGFLQQVVDPSLLVT